ncbi:MAG: hypothetical protein KKD77_21060 [Gammaproteobacteria bacterium]|nr:hypothetical protein [Gammaproteobacteria bacterium]
MTDYTPRPDPEVLKRWPVSSWEWPRIIVYVPLLPAMPYADEVFPHFWAIAQQGVPFLPTKFGCIDAARNRAAEALLISEFTHILMLDGDQKHPVDIVQRLARHVIADPERLVVAGIYHNRRPPFAPLAWRVDHEQLTHAQMVDYQPGRLEVDAAAAGCMLVDRRVFERIERPWFYHSYEGVQEAKAEFNYPTEDIGFCVKLFEAGIGITLDTTVNSPHAATTWIDRAAMLAYQQAEANRDA